MPKTIRALFCLAQIALLSSTLAFAAPHSVQPSNCNKPAAHPALKISLPGRPFEALATHDGCWIFVSVISTAASFARAGGPNPHPSGIAVLQRQDGKIKLKRFFRLLPGPAGIVLTHDGKLLIAADQPEVAFLDVHRLETGKQNALLGAIRDGDRAQSVYLNVTADDRFLFVSDELLAQVSVINLAHTRKTGFTQDSLIGAIPVGIAPVGIAFSKDNRYAFITSEIWRHKTPRLFRGPAYKSVFPEKQPPSASESAPWPVTCRPELPGNSSKKQLNPEGALTIVSLATAETNPARSVIESIPAGCSPVRVEVSPDGLTVYVTARKSNALLAFDSPKLLPDAEHDPVHALIARIPVGIAPVGLALINHGRAAIVANSSRFGGRGGQSLTVVDLSKISNPDSAAIGTIPAGRFPRELHLTSDGKTLLLTNFGSQQLELLDLPRLSSLLKR